MENKTRYSCHKLWVRTVADIVRLFVHFEVKGKGNIVDDGQPAVFVCNHGAIIGPVSAVIYLPVSFRPWINVAMTDRDTAEKTMTHTYDGRRFLIFSGKAKKLAIRMASRIISSAVNAFDPVPVSRTDSGAMLGTLRSSIDTLEGGTNLLIFPENPGEGKYRADSFRDLHPVFAMLGRLYYARTGMCLRFYPSFADKDRKIFNIGAPVTYTPGGDEKAELARIVAEVRDAMVRMSL